MLGINQVAGEKIDQLIPATNEVPQTAGTRSLAADIMAKRGYNPLEKMIDLAERLERHEEDINAPNLHADRLLKIHTTMAKFYAPQPKSLDVSVRSENNFTITTVDYSGMIAERAHLIPQSYQPALIGVVEAKVEEVLNASD